jgi:hypothetical protein
LHYLGLFCSQKCHFFAIFSEKIFYKS